MTIEKKSSAGIYLSVIMPVYNERFHVKTSIERVLNLQHSLISRLELIIVDDGSTDGSLELLREIAQAQPDRVSLVEHQVNSGKGAAVVSGIALANGEITVIQDADLEYNPQDIPKLLVPFSKENADAVYGSRFASSEYRRVLYYRHSVGNRMLTTMSNILTDLNLTDMETCYKCTRTSLLQSIPLRSRDFRIEPELTFKLAKRKAKIFEVPITYAGRTYEQGKKIGLKDAFLAVMAMFHWWVVDDCYGEEEYGSRILTSLAGTPRFNRWMSEVLRPHVGNEVLEIGAGIGNLTQTLIPRDRYTATDIHPPYLERLGKMAEGVSYLDVRHVDLTNKQDFAALRGRYDTVICLNVLEHVEDEIAALSNIGQALNENGKAIILVPQNNRIFGSLDEVLGHHRRYSRQTLSNAIETANLHVETMFDFNRISTPAWWWNGKVLKRTHFGKLQLKIFDSLVWFFKRIDRFLPFHGVSIVAVVRKNG